MSLRQTLPFMKMKSHGSSHHVANININNNNNNNNSLGVAAAALPSGSTRNSWPEKQKKKRQKLKRHIDIDKLPAEQTNLVPNGQRQAGGADNAAADDDALFCPCCGHPKEGTMWVEGNGRSQFLKLVGSDMGGFKFCATCYGRHYYHVRGRKATPTPYDERCKLFLKFNPNGPKGEKFPLPYPPPPTTPVTLPPPPAPTPHSAPRLGSKVSRLSGGMPQHGEPAFLDACVLEKRIRASATDEFPWPPGTHTTLTPRPSSAHSWPPRPSPLLATFLASSQPTHTFRTFEEARTYVRTLGLKSKYEWNEWSKSGARPHDIPGAPQHSYKSSGWTSYGDFLGYDQGKRAQRATASKFRSFEEARSYVRTLGLKSQEEWIAWSKSGARPHDIPAAPDQKYKSSGWLSCADFLGYGVDKVADCSFRTFEEARTYVRKLGLKSYKEWWAWSASGARPNDIPSRPDKTYASTGWLSIGDFLGYKEGKVTSSYRSFEDARAYVRALGLKSQEEWIAWSKSGARPHDIPSQPAKTYKSSGWLSIGDFLGYDKGKRAQRATASKFRSFEEARTYVRALGLKSWKEWEVWKKSGARPHDIPSSPYDAYALTGWLSMGDFLGYAEGQGAKSTRNSKFRTFEQARTYVRTLGLKSAREWQAWSKSGSRPPDIPSHPDVTYTSSGWLSYGDFLGYDKGKASVSTENVCIELIALPRALEREPNDITLPQISQRFIVFDSPMLEMRYAAMYVAQMLREDGYKGINDGDIELRLLSGDMVSLTEHKIRDVLVLTASGTSASGSTPLLKVHYRHVRGGALDTLDHAFKEE